MCRKVPLGPGTDLMAGLPFAPITRPSLLARLADPGDSAGWDEFVRVYGPLVFRHARRRLPEADADDVTQKVFVRLLAALRRGGYRPDRGRFRDWLGAVVRNEISRHWRDGTAAAAVPPDVLDGANPAPPAEPEWVEAFYAHLLAEALAACRSRFETDTWGAFTGVWLDDRPAAEVAAQFGRQVDWVYVAKSRCLSAVTAEVERLSEDGIPHAHGPAPTLGPSPAGGPAG